MKTENYFWFEDREIFINTINTQGNDYKVVTIIYKDTTKKPRSLCYNLSNEEKKEIFEKVYNKTREDFLAMWM